jgi:hypothetical protein
VPCQLGEAALFDQLRHLGHPRERGAKADNELGSTTQHRGLFYCRPGQTQSPQRLTRCIFLKRRGAQLRDLARFKME